jgi:hypothetical protein
MVEHSAFQAFDSSWFPVVLILVFFLVARERSHIKERLQHIKEIEAQTGTFKKAFDEQRERLERHFSEQLDELRRASNVIWIRSELRDADEDSDTNPRRKGLH